MSRGCCTCGADLYDGESDDDCRVPLCVDLHVMEQTACGWAFDAGMREAERDRALAQIERDGFVVFAAKVDWERSARDHDAARGQFLEAIRTCVPVSARDTAVAAERERCGKVDEERAALRARIGRMEEHIRKTGCGCPSEGDFETEHDDPECLWVVLDGAPAPREG